MAAYKFAPTKREIAVKLPCAERAEVDIAKLRGYCLNTEHPEGKHKARVFRTALGLGAEDAEELRRALLDAARTTEATPGAHDEYGQRFLVDFTLRRDRREARIRSAWIIRSGEAIVRLTSCYIL